MMNYKVSFSNIESAMNAKKMFELRQASTSLILSGEFKKARSIQKEFAKMAVNDFEAYKALPLVRYNNVPFKVWLAMLGKSIKFRLYKMFSPLSNDEKQLNKLSRSYLSNLSDSDKKKKTIDITIPSLF